MLPSRRPQYMQVGFDTSLITTLPPLNAQLSLGYMRSGWSATRRLRGSWRKIAAAVTERTANNGRSGSVTLIPNSASSQATDACRFLVLDAARAQGYEVVVAAIKEVRGSHPCKERKDAAPSVVVVLLTIGYPPHA